MELSNHIVREQQPTYLWDSGIDESVVGSRNLSHKAVESSSNLLDAGATGEFPVVVKTEQIDNDYEESRHVQGYCVEMNRFPFITFNGDQIKTENFTQINVKPEPDMDVPVFFMKDQESQCDFVGDKYGNRQGQISRKKNCAKTPLVYIDVATGNDFRHLPRRKCEQKKPAKNFKVDESKESKGKVQETQRVKKSTSGKTKFGKKTSRSRRKNGKVGKELQTKVFASGNTNIKGTSREKIQAEDEKTNAKPLSGTNRKRQRRPVEDTDGDDDKTKVSIRRQKREKYFCDICEKDIIGAQKIKQHKRQHESPPSGKLLRCTLCSMAFRSQERFDGHMRTHRGEDAFICSVCGKGFRLLGHLRSHMKSHTGDNINKLLRCTLCTMTFRSQERFDGHMRTHRGEDAFICSVCGKGFRLLGHLRSHMKSHTGDNINKLLRCTLCTMTFRSQERFDGHMRTHRGEDAFSCSLCGKGFHLLGHLRSHMKSHTGEKPYKCEICGKGFAEACKRVRHLKTHIRRGELALNGRSTSDLGDVSDPSTANGSLVDSLGNASSVLYRPYKCSICTKTFTRTVFLVNHVKDHKNGKIIPILDRFKQQLSESENVCVNGMDVTDMTVNDSTHDGSNPVDDDSRKSDKVTNGSDIVELRKCDNVTNCSGNVHSRKCEKVPNGSGKVESKQCDQITNCIEDGRSPDKADEGSNHMVSSDMPCTQESGDAAKSDKDDIPVPKDLEIRPVVEAVSEWSRKLEHSEERSKNANVINMKNYPFQHVQCAYCDELFCDQRIIEGHVLLHTSAVFLQKEKTREYTCEYCGKSFYKRGHLKAHVMIHTGERPYICEVCAKGFTESSKLTRHLKTHYNSASKKDTKSENSDSPLTLSNLLFRKSTKKNNHFCEYCGKSFIALSRLNIHVMQHTGERPFTCDLCGKGFCVARGLRRHLNTHERKKDVWISGASSSEEENEMSDVSYPWEGEEENMDMENVENEEDQYEEVDWPESSDLKDDKDDLTDLSDSFSISDAETDHDQKKNVKTKASKHRKKKIDNEETDDKKLDDEDDDEDNNKSKNVDEDEVDMSEDVDDNDDESKDVEWSDILDGGDGEEVGEFMPFRAFQAVRSRDEKDETDKDISDDVSEDGDSPSSQV